MILILDTDCSNSHLYFYCQVIIPCILTLSLVRGSNRFPSRKIQPWWIWRNAPSCAWKQPDTHVWPLTSITTRAHWLDEISKSWAQRIWTRNIFSWRSFHVSVFGVWPSVILTQSCNILCKWAHLIQVDNIVLIMREILFNNGIALAMRWDQDCLYFLYLHGD